MVRGIDWGEETLSGEVNDQCLKNGIDIFTELRAKYPERTVENMDIMLNSITTALICMRNTYGNPTRDDEFPELVKYILELNPRKNSSLKGRAAPLPEQEPLKGA